MTSSKSYLNLEQEILDRLNLNKSDKYHMICIFFDWKAFNLFLFYMQFFFMKNNFKTYIACYGLRLTKRDDYFLVTFDHFWRNCHFMKQLGQYKKLARAYNQTTKIKFNLSKFVKRPVSTPGYTRKGLLCSKFE